MCKEMVMRKLFFCLWMVCATVTFASDWHRERVRAYRQGCDAALDREDLLATASLIALVVEAAAEAALEEQPTVTAEQQEVVDVLSALSTALMEAEDEAERKRAQRRLRLAYARLKVAEAELEAALEAVDNAEEENDQAAALLKALLKEMAK
jgi:hypothetical protein